MATRQLKSTAGRTRRAAALDRQDISRSSAPRRNGVEANKPKRAAKDKPPGKSLVDLWNIHSASLGTADAVHATLREAIISGVLKAGDKLGEEFLGSEFNVSRTPVREALMRLAAEQLAVRITRKGLSVRSISEREVLDFYAIRIVLDGLAARLAAKVASPAEIAQMRWLNEQMFDAQDLTSQHDFSIQFHAALFEASHNRLLQHFGQELLDWLRGVSGSTFADHDRLAKAFKDHAAIVMAIEKRDADEAEKRAAAHMKNALAARAEKLHADSTA